MRWCLLITNLIILLTLGMEQCWYGAAGVKDASHLVCVLDDDETDAELKQGLVPEETLWACDMSALPGWHAMIRLAHANVVAPLQGAENGKAPSGMRLHRWLCQERC